MQTSPGCHLTVVQNESLYLKTPVQYSTPSVGFELNNHKIPFWCLFPPYIIFWNMYSIVGSNCVIQLKTFIVIRNILQWAHMYSSSQWHISLDWFLAENSPLVTAATQDQILKCCPQRLFWVSSPTLVTWRNWQYCSEIHSPTANMHSALWCVQRPSRWITSGKVQDFSHMMLVALSARLSSAPSHPTKCFIYDFFLTWKRYGGGLVPHLMDKKGKLSWVLIRCNGQHVSAEGTFEVTWNIS